MKNKEKIKILIDYIYDKTVEDDVIDKLLFNDDDLLLIFLNILNLKIESKKTKSEVLKLFIDTRQSLERYTKGVE